MSISPSSENDTPSSVEMVDLDAPPPPPPHHGFGSRIRNYFLTGLIVTGPVAITVYLVWSIVTWVDDLVRPFIPATYRPETYLPVKIPGTGLIIAFLALTLLGFLTANLVGRSLVEFGESLLNRMPIVRPIYKSLKQIFETLFARFPLAAPERRGGGPPAGQGPYLGIHALHAEPDHRFFLLPPAHRCHRARYFGRAGNDPAHVGRHGPAPRWRPEEAVIACRGRPRHQGCAHGARNDTGEIAPVSSAARRGFYPA
jgi:hypothetical protein